MHYVILACLSWEEWAVFRVFFFGVIFVRILDELVLFVSPVPADWFPWIGSAPAAGLRVTAFGLVLALFLIKEHGGLAHRWEILKASSRLYPFAY
jgi:branched-chain amino acid transport system permease protein